MSWHAGAELSNVLWATVSQHLPAAARQQIAQKWVDEFCGNDADVWGTDAHREAYPDLYKDEAE